MNLENVDRLFGKFGNFISFLFSGVLIVVVPFFGGMLLCMYIDLFLEDLPPQYSHPNIFKEVISMYFFSLFILSQFLIVKKVRSGNLFNLVIL